MSTVLFYINAVIRSILPFVPVVVVIRFAINLLNGKIRRMNLFHETGVICLMLTMIGILSQTVNFKHIMQYGFQKQGGMNVVLFDEIRGFIKSGFTVHSVINLAGNIFLFLPVGFLFALLWKRCRHFYAIFIIGALCSLFIETMQLFTVRASDIDDVILNTLGALLGYILFKMLYFFAPNLCNRFMN